MNIVFLNTFTFLIRLSAYRRTLERENILRHNLSTISVEEGGYTGGRSREDGMLQIP